MKNNRSCPVGYGQTDEHLSRAYAGLTALLLIPVMLTGRQWILYILAADFMLRVMGGIRAGLFCIPLSTLLSKLGVEPRPVNAEPKKFAVKTGLAFTLLALAARLAGWDTAYYVILSLFLLAAAADALTGFCLACRIYALWSGVKKKSSPSDEGIFKS
ncbi:MAG: DUF4395 domain-containing protein [Chlorobi bacterium]|nr:DUF4395 domain-containing protein [Chlorobiota bacterium]